MIPMNCFRPSRVKRSWAAAETTEASGTAAATAARTSAAGTPSRPPARMPSTRSPRSNRFCAVRRSNTAAVAVPSDLTVPKRAMPTTS